MRTLMLGGVVALFGGAALANPPIEFSANAMHADTTGCQSVTYTGQAEMKVTGAEVNGREQTKTSPGATAVFTLFRADRIVYYPAHSGVTDKGCKGVRRIDLFGNVSYRTPQCENTPLGLMTYYPDTDTMRTLVPSGEAVSLRPSLSPSMPRARVETRFCF